MTCNPIFQHIGNCRTKKSMTGLDSAFDCMARNRETEQQASGTERRHARDKRAYPAFSRRAFSQRPMRNKLTHARRAHYPCALMVPGDGIKRERSGGGCLESAAAPATVSGKSMPKGPLGNREGRQWASTREPGDLPSTEVQAAARGGVSRSASTACMRSPVAWTARPQDQSHVRHD